MKTLLHSTCPVAPPLPTARLHRPRRAFSLVEVTLALGIVTFAMLSVVGVLPTALASGKQSLDQNRAAAIASTLFASFRSQPFSKVGYLDVHFRSDGNTPTDSAQTVSPLNLNSIVQGGVDTVQFYATFLNVNSEVIDTNSYGTQRRFSLTASKPETGASYLVTLSFNNAPDGMVLQPPRDNQASSPPAQANQIAMVISPANQATNIQTGVSYRFVSTVANRSN